MAFVRRGHEPGRAPREPVRNQPNPILACGLGEAGALVSGGANGITISAGASDAVSLRGLTIKGIGFGSGNGIMFNSDESSTVENCAIRSLTGASVGIGIVFVPTTSSSLVVSTTFVTDNSSAAIFIAPHVSASASAALDHAGLHNNGGDGLFVSGLSTSGTVNAVVADSVATGNVNGLLVHDNGSGTANLMAIRSVASNNVTGFFATGANATIRVGQSTVTATTNGWEASLGGVLRSYGDHNVDGNAGNQSPMPPSYSKTVARNNLSASRR